MKLITQRNFEIKSRNWALDWTKVIFSLFIALFHLGYASWYFYVEGFFFITGIYLCQAAIKKPQNTFIYVFKKWLSLLPYILFSILLELSSVTIIHICNHTFTWKWFGNMIWRWILEIIPLITNFTTMANFWYLCSLFLAILVVYPFIKLTNKKVKWLPLLISITIYSVCIGIFHKIDMCTIPTNEWVSTLLNWLRAIAGLLTGCTIYYLKEPISLKINNDKIKIFNTFLFIICLIATIIVPIFYKNQIMDALYIFLMAVVIFISYSRIGIVSYKFDIFNHKKVQDYSATLFFTHQLIRNICYQSQWLLSNRWAVFLICLISTIPCIYIINLIERSINKIILRYKSKKALNLLLIK